MSAAAIPNTRATKNGDGPDIEVPRNDDDPARTEELWSPYEDAPLLEDEAEVPPSSFAVLREWRKLPFPPGESLMGVARGGTNLCPRYGWWMVWGPEGSGKTSIVADAIFHSADGRPWLGYPTLREMRWILVVNEGIPGGLQDKLNEKLETWDGDVEGILDRIAVYSSPWGEFTLANQKMLEHLRDFAKDFGADYVNLDPLHTVGTVGAGSPKETEEFKHKLRELGMWDSLGVLTTHHSNKAGMISGDWGRHPDTMIRIEKDGQNPASKYTLQKARPADPNELNRVQILEWVTETLGYKRNENAKSPVALGDANRDKVLAAVVAGAVDVTTLEARTGFSDRTVTKHLRALQAAGKLTLAKGEKGRLSVAFVGTEEDDFGGEDE